MALIAARQQREGNGNLTFYNQDTGEIIPVAPFVFRDDFAGPATINTFNWTVVDVSVAGDTAPIIVADKGNGVLRLTLDNTSEAQESGVTWGDQRSLVLNQGLVIQFVLSLNQLPTLLSEAVWGLAGNKNAVADTVAESIWFKVDGSGAVVVESDDTVNEKTDEATGVTLSAGTPLIFTIDCTTINDCKFWIGKVPVATGTTFDMSTVSALALQPYIHIAKASGEGLGQVDVDVVSVAQQRSSA